MSSIPYFPFYPADYLADTAHLSTEQHGAYLLLLITAWSRGGRLPADHQKLARIARVNARRWHIISEDVLAFFEVDGDEIYSPRMVRDYKKAVSKSEKRSAIGRLGGSAKSLKNKEPRLAKAKQLPSIPEPEPEEVIEIDKSISCGDGSPPSFSAFWEAYPRKAQPGGSFVRGNRKKAQAAWSRLKSPDRLAAMAGLESYKRAHPDKSGYVTHGERYLTNRMWEDYLTAEAESAGETPIERYRNFVAATFRPGQIPGKDFVVSAGDSRPEIREWRRLRSEAEEYRKKQSELEGGNVIDIRTAARSRDNVAA